MELSNQNRSIDSLSNLESSGLISDDVMQYIYTINVTIIVGALCVLSILTNIVNIVVFIRLKFKDTINIALLGLALSDLCSLICLLFTSICFNPLLRQSDLPVLTVELQFKTSGWLYITFTRVSAFVTMYITLERCLCVTFPLRVKNMLTPKRVTSAIAAIYVIIIGSMIINLSYFRLDWKFVPRLNRTMIGVIFFGPRILLQTICYYLSLFYLIFPFVGVIICSVVLVLRLNQRRKWLQASCQDSNETSRSEKDRQVVRMVVWVAVIFITTFTPSVIVFLVVLVEPDLNFDGRYKNLFFLLISTNYMCNALNCGLNIFVYIKMSSKFSSKFSELFRRRENKTSKL